MNIKNKVKFRVGQDVYYDTNIGTTEMGTINELNMTIEGSEHLGRKFVRIDTGRWKNGWPEFTTVTMNNIFPIL